MKKGYSNKKQQFQNERVYMLWYERLHDFCLTFVKWNGFPFPEEIVRDVEMYLNELLFRGDTVGYIKTIPETSAGEIDGYIPIIGAAIPADAVTWYGGSYRYSIKTERNTYHVNRDAVALCKPTPCKRSLASVCEWYAMQLAQADQSTRVNLINQNTPAIIQSPPGQELTYANMFEQVAGFKPVVYGRENLLGDEKNGIFAYRYLQPAQYVADKIEMLKHDILNDFFNELGISAKSIEKRAQLISDELNIDYTSNSLSKNVYMDCRKAFCEEIRRIYGDNVTVEYNVDILGAIRDKQTESADNRDISGTGSETYAEGVADE